MKKSVILVVFCLTVLLSSATFADNYRFFTKGDIGNSFGRLWPQRDKVNENLKRVQDLYKELLAHSTTPKDPVYLKLATAVEGLKTQTDAYNAKVNEMAKLQDQILALYGDSDQIRSNQPNWNDFLKLKGDLDKEWGQLDVIAKAGNNAGQDFFNQCSQAGVRMNTMVEYQARIKSALAKLDGALADAHKKISEAHEAFKRFTATKEIAAKQKAVDEIDLLLGQLDVKREEISKIIALFNKKTAKMVKLYEGPGIEKITIFEELKAKANEINDLSHKVNAQAQILK